MKKEKSERRAPYIHNPEDPRYIPFELDHFVSWSLDYKSVPTTQALEKFEQLIEENAVERELQNILTECPELFYFRPDCSARIVIPNVWLSRDNQIDFILGDVTTFGLQWTMVEIERPGTPVFIKSGDFAHEMTHAMGQIDKWRIWLSEGRNLAQIQEKYHIKGFSEKSAAKLIAGRRPLGGFSPAEQAARHECLKTRNISLRTWDGILSDAKTFHEEWKILLDENSIKNLPQANKPTSTWYKYLKQIAELFQKKVV